VDPFTLRASRLCHDECLARRTEAGLTHQIDHTLIEAMKAR